ncbi:MAG TPA: O-antigen ligase family protein [Candidatus Saccharimonadales bacterium]|nr:O-antigen ligase family protein [Candidatus Saccharimonadales bacterium]
MDSKDLLKAVVLLGLFLVAGPALGAVIRGRRKWQGMVFFLMCFMTISGFFHAAEWGLTLHDLPDYRGHARGFHVYFNEVLAVALIVASYLESPRRFRWVPPGLVFYLAYIAMSLVSIVNAPSALYVSMAAFKAVEVILIFVAAYNYLQTVEEARLMLTAFALTMIWQLIVVLKMKYVDHLYQVMGTFEHQNALAMYANLIGLVFLGAGVGPKQPRSTLYLIGFLVCLWIVECTLSRGGLVALAAGAVAVMFLSLADKITVRRLVIVGGLAALGMVGVVIALNTILARFHDSYNADSALTRLMLNTASREMVRDYPLGVGWNNFGVMIDPPYHYGDIIDNYFKRTGDETTADRNKGIVESHYFLLLSETGYEGLAAYFVFIGYFLWCNARAAWCFRNHFLGAASIGIGIGCLSNYLQSTLERVLTQPRNMMEWLLLLALTSRIETWRRQAKKERALARNDPNLSEPMGHRELIR